MKIFKACLIIIALSVFGISFINSSSSGNSNPRTGAPNESTCTSCHGGTSLQTSGTNYNKITLNSNWTGNGYIPDSTYTINIGYKESGKSKFGFMVTALDKNDEAAGTFTSLNNRTSSFSSTVGGKTRYYIEHTSNGNSAVSTDSASWTFEWTAPSNLVGDITFYVALNVANNNGGSSGDVIYNKKFTINASSLLPKATAALSDSIACTGKKVNFSGTSTQNATVYSWRFPGGVPSTSSDQNPSIQYPSTGTKTAYLISTNNKGNSKEDTFSFVVNIGATKPTFTAFPPTLPLCKGDTGIIEVSPRNNHIYVWNTGDTAIKIPVDTAGFYNVLAVRTNGCTSMSDDFAVLETQKPSFKVSYGLSNDTVCVNEDLLILMNNTNGYADSYSLNSANGPFSRDSFVIKSILSGLNQYKVWAKGKNGCVSSSDTATFYGLDTFEGPKITKTTKYVDSVVFYWDNSFTNGNYEYSIDSGNSWIKTNVDSASIILNKPSDWIDFWIRYKSNYACNYSTTNTLRTQSVGCTTPVGSLIANKTIYCVGDSIIISYSSQNNNKESIWYQNMQIDSTLEFIATKSADYSIQVLDSQQITCGFYIKSISVLVDSLDDLQYFSGNQIFGDTLFCGVLDSQSAALIISPSNIDTNISHSFINTINKSVQFFNSTTPIYPGRTGQFYIVSTNENNCKFNSDTSTIYISEVISPGFNWEWIDSFKYRFTFDFKEPGFIRRLYILDKTIDFNSSNDSVVLDLSDYANLNIEIVHELIDTMMFKYKFSDSCSYRIGKMLSIRNLSVNDINAINPRWYPNPSRYLSELLCFGCNEKSKVTVLNSMGKILFSGTPESLANYDGFVSNGLYWIITEDSINGQISKQVIEIIR